MADILKFMHCGCTYTFGNAKGLPEEAFGDGSDGDCTVCYDAETVGNVFWEAKEYNFDNLTICEGVKLRFCGQGVPIIRVKNCFVNEGEINLRAPLLNIGQTVEEKYTGKEISSYKNDCYDIALSHYNSMVSCCETLKSCLTLENLSGVCASGGAAKNGRQTGYPSGKGGNGGCVGANGASGGNGAGGYQASCGAAGGTSSYANAGGGGGGGGFFAVYGSPTINNEAESGGNASDGIGGKGGNGANVTLTDNSRYAETTACYAAGGGGGGGGYGYCQGGDGGCGGKICAKCSSNMACKSGDGGNGGNSYLGKAGNGGNSWGAYQFASGGRGGNGGCSYCGDGGDAGYTACGSEVHGGCSIYGNGGCIRGCCLTNGYGGSSVYGNGGNANSCCSIVYGGNSYYGNGGDTNAYTGYPGCSVYGNGGTSFANCYSYTKNGGHSIYGRGGETCSSGCCGGNGIEGGKNNYGSGATGNTSYYGIARGGVYGLGLFANSLNNEGCIYGRGGCGRICSRGAEIVLGYKTLLCNTGGISYEGCATACNGKLTVIQG